MTPDFESSAHAHAKVFGAPDYKPVMLNLETSSIAGLSSERIEEYAETIFDDVVAILSGRDAAARPTDGGKE